MIPRALMANSVGKNELRVDGWAKVQGTAGYVDDLVFPDMLFGRTIRSNVACGVLHGIRADLDASFTLVTAADVPGLNAIRLLEDDQPCLAAREVQHCEEPVALIAHASKEALLRARVDIDLEPGAPVFDPRKSKKVFKEIAIEKGDLAAGFAAAEHVVEGEYSTGLQEQLYIETNGVIALPEAEGITIIGSLQCPYYVQKALVALLGLPPEKVRVVQAETGGGFGGKEEYPSMIAAHAALLARKCGKPVKLVYDRAEDMAATTKRHPSIVRHRTGVRADGTIVAMDIEVLLDGGAYMTLSPVVLSRGVLHATGPYRCEHVRVRGRAVATNTPPNGAFRGFGAPQTQFAAEVHMDRIAEALRLDPLRVRERNALRRGDTTATGQKMGRDCSALEVLRAAVQQSDYKKKRRSWKKSNRGIGLALVFHGAGFTGAGEVRLASKASLELTEGGARILVGSTEIGQGTRTILAQIVADELEWPFESIEVAAADTARVPDSGPTVASRTCMVVGRILQRCASKLKKTLAGRAPKDYLAEHGPLVITKSYDPPKSIVWDEDHYRGDAYGAYGFACNVAEIELDRGTGEVKPLRLTAAVDVGRAIHPQLAAGQVEGGTAQGLGFALLEEVKLERGRMSNASLTNYAIPTTLDTPPIDVILLEKPTKYGPFGAKGLGEIPIDAPAPAVLNALRHLGIDLRALPATPEQILEAPCVSS